MKRARHNLSNYKLFSGNMGELIPCGLMEVVRGSSIKQVTQALVRTAPLVRPVMHPVHVKIHHWYVPHRINWPEYEDFITGGRDGNDATVFPKITLNPSVGDLADYLGVTPGTNQSVSALPFRAYARIVNEYYLDGELDTPLALSTASGTDSTTSTALQNVRWMKDYFTTARPEPQLGDEVVLPISGTAPVTGDALVTYVPGADGAKLMKVHKASTGNIYSSLAGSMNVDSSGGFVNGGDGGSGAFLDPNGRLIVDTAAVGAASTLEADLSAASAVPINDVRLAFALQRFKEARARFGARYPEFLMYYGIKPSDGRLQRPEYLGGGRQTIQFSEIIQSAPNTSGGTSGTTGVGDLKGHGIGNARSNKYKRFFEEDGYVISLMSVTPITMYVQGTPRHFTYSVKEDMFQKELQHIGQQEVLNKEVYAAHASPTGTFGFQDRYDHLRRIENTIAGEFRTTLADWHMARIFSSDPALNSDFVKANPTNRIYASTATDQLQIMAHHTIHVKSPVAKKGTSFVY